MATVAIAAAIGGAVAVGSYLLFGNRGNNTQVEGSRLASSRLTSSTEGASVADLYGRQRLNGQIIWATQFKETVNTETQKQKSGGKGGGSQTVTTTTYNYSISLAIAFCRGNNKATISRMWADGDEIDMSLIDFTFYPGSDTQEPDPTIEEVQGAGMAPAYRGVAYVVIKDLQLATYGNRVPQITAEIVVPLETDDPVDLQNSAEAFCLIPASGEHTYDVNRVNIITGGSDPSPLAVTQGSYTTKPDNIHNAFRLPNARVGLDNLVRMQNNLDAIMLVVAWFGDDLRAGVCNIEPCHEGDDRYTTYTNDKSQGDAWQVMGHGREHWRAISMTASGQPHYGGTPSDEGVKRLIAYLRNDLGLRVIFYPFVMMDVPPGNSLPNPYSDNAAEVGQPVFPWRGRITASPAPGYAGSVDMTAAAGTQINAWFDKYDIMVEHYAQLCVDAGGVDGFVIGTELPGITKTRDAMGSYPAVNRLVTTAATVRGIVGNDTKLTYAADWSEWVHTTDNGHWFHLDPIWSSPNIDAVGVDNYLPMSDWRDGTQHLDYDGVNGPVSCYDVDYMKANIEGGEYYDWYYASYSDRAAQIRTPIFDGAHGKHWIYRTKDFRAWWSNYHYNRPNYVESGTPTGWVPYSKPLWFTEFGFGAVDKSTNQPNVFYDPKSSESAYPYFSSGLRDDFMQRIATETTLDYWRHNSPVSPGGMKMLEPHNMFIWTWDLRPFPDWPARENVWSDGDLWFKGHWFTGRLESVPLARLVAALCEKAGLTSAEYDVSGLYGSGALVRGYEVDKVGKVRAQIEALMDAYLFDAFESEGKIKFILRSNTKVGAISDDDFVVDENNSHGVTLTRGQETELPMSVKITFIDEFNDYNSGSVDGKTARGYSQNVEEIELPLLLTTDYCRSLADGLVQQRWIERQTGDFTLPPSMVRFDPGDALTFPVGNHSITGRLTVVSSGEDRAVEYAAFDPGIFNLPNASNDERLPGLANIYGSVDLVFLDLPLFTGEEEQPWSPRYVVSADPWPGSASLYRRVDDGTYEYNSRQDYRSGLGELLAPLNPGPVGVWDRGTELKIKLDFGALSSVTEIAALNSALAIAVYNEAVQLWEVIQFATVTPDGGGTYTITDLLRGQLGTEGAITNTPLPIKSRVVVLEPATLQAVNLTSDQANDAITYLYGPSRYPNTDDTYTQATHTGQRVGLRPYSPTDVQLTTNGAGDLTVTWVRRTRYSGDNWDVQEPPLNEQVERYRLRVFNGATVVRTVTVEGASSFVYTTARQSADFGAAQTAITVDVAQYGTDYGGYGPVRRSNLRIKRATP